MKLMTYTLINSRRFCNFLHELCAYPLLDEANSAGKTFVNFLERVKKGAASHFSRGLSTDECFDFPQKAIQENGTISSHQGLF
jgi:hypothetical protein